MPQTRDQRPRLILRGIFWNSSYQIFSTGVSFVSMLVLVRIIPPAEYGRAAAVVGILTMLNAFNCGNFMAQALQLPDENEPDWSQHYGCGLYIQASLSVIGHAIAGITWLLPDYRPIAPLPRLGALGLILDWPGQLGLAMMRRSMDFGRMRLMFAISLTVKVAIIIALGVGGAGALAIVAGSNVASAIPFGVDLLIVRGWRPQAGWWRWPDWAQYRSALRFGLLQASSAVLFSARGGFEATILPPTLGFQNIGLWNRAQALFSTTVGRLGTVVNESIYPVLPRYAADSEHYPRQATLYFQVLLWIAMPAALFLGFSGPVLSRVLYGSRWIAADPMLWPGVLIGFGLLLFSTCSAILLAANRLRACFSLDVIAACLSLPMLFVAWKSSSVAAYAWAAAAGQLTASVIALVCASIYLQRGWFRVVLLPPLVASSVALFCMLTGARALGLWFPTVRLLTEGTIFGFSVVVTYRTLFAKDLARIVDYIPGSHHMRNWFRLPALAEGSAEAN